MGRRVSSQQEMTPDLARQLLAALRTSGGPMYDQHELANLSDEDALLDADAFGLEVPAPPACPATYPTTATSSVRCDRTDSHTHHRNFGTRHAWTDPCEIAPDSGHRAGGVCGKQSRFTVNHPDGDRRVCGRHIGTATEAASSPSRRAVTVLPDFYHGQD